MPKLNVNYIPGARNYDDIKFQKIREKIDPLYNKIHDEVSIAYYDYWRKDISHPVVIGGKTYDKQATVEESCRLMNELCNLAWEKRQLLFHEVNMALPAEEQYPEDGYRYTRDANGNIARDIVQAAIDRVRKYELEGKLLDYGVDAVVLAGEIQ